LREHFSLIGLRPLAFSLKPRDNTQRISTVNRILLIADDREAVSGVPDLLAQMPEVELRIGRLVAGDYRVEESVLIERKTASDFAQSLVTGRLFEQAARMAKSEFRPAYILEGHPGDWTALGVRREALQGALITLMVILDIPVLRAADDPLRWTAIGATARSEPRALSSDQGQAEPIPAASFIANSSGGWHRTRPASPRPFREHPRLL
jgi:ERCC4-type nuclease